MIHSNSPQLTSSHSSSAEPDMDVEEALSGLLSMLSDEVDPSIFLGKSKTIGEFDKLELVSARGQAIVIKARDKQLERHVILKLCKKNSSQVSQENAIREGQAMSRIDSPYVAKCFGVRTHCETPYLIIEYINGETLDQYARRCQPTVEESIRLTRQIVEGLHAAHEQGVLHLDLKPSNILVDRNGNCRIIDFGLAQSMDGKDLLNSSVSGTPGYLAPERALGSQKLLPQTDIFGVGAIFYFLATGRPPFDGSTREEVVELARQGVYPAPDELGIDLPKTVQAMLRRCLATDPNGRYRTMAELFRPLGIRKGTSYWGAMSMSFVMLIALAMLGYQFLPSQDGTPPAQIERVVEGDQIEKHVRAIAASPETVALNSDFRIEAKLTAPNGVEFPSEVKNGQRVWLVPESGSATLTLSSPSELRFFFFDSSNF